VQKSNAQFFSVITVNVWTQPTALNLSLPKFGKFLKNHLTANLKGIWNKGWDKMAPSRAKVGVAKTGDAKLLRFLKFIYAAKIRTSIMYL